MTSNHLRRFLLLAALGTLTPPPRHVGAQATAARPTAESTALPSLPARLTDEEFWAFTLAMSEPEGSFASENLLSNERGYQVVIPGLLSAPRTGKVYLGVGPEQNFTYIAALHPSMVVIIDIRRGNLLGHLLYKALFELSADRAEFVSRLFSKPRPSGLDTGSTAHAITDAYYMIFGDSALYAKNKRDVIDVLTKTHGYALSESDIERMTWIYDQFYFNGLDLTYTSTRGGGGFRGGGGGGMPSYKEIVTRDDGTGLNRGFLGNEANWRFIKELHGKNLIVPVVGNFGGDKAIRSVGTWLKARGGTVGAFYASNVEQYLFQDGIAGNYYANVAELPIDSTSVIIRSQSGGRGGGFGGGGFGGRGGLAVNRICSIPELLAANRGGRIGGYGDIFSYCEP